MLPHLDCNYFYHLEVILDYYANKLFLSVEIFKITEDIAPKIYSSYHMYSDLLGNIP